MNSRTIPAATLSVLLAGALSACGEVAETASNAASAGASLASQGASAGASLASQGADAAQSAASSGASAASSAATAASGAVAAGGTLIVPDARSDGRSITIDAVTLTGAEKGWVVLHRDANGAPGDPIGHASVNAGLNNDVTVMFDTPQQTGKYWAMLHVDAGTTGTYEFPGADVPVTVDGRPVTKPVTLTVQ